MDLANGCIIGPLFFWASYYIFYHNQTPVSTHCTFGDYRAFRFHLSIIPCFLTNVSSLDLDIYQTINSHVGIKGLKKYWPIHSVRRTLYTDVTLAIKKKE